ncbi:MAG: single-stranded-DNA-specific exonuclease RecJ [Clostridium sp.]|uniref:single-stranded-DNA-specific exonuclease RecJ n=1 Tax=Clostridium sp. TaxID=1506 RepID=UPI003032697C
MKTIWKQTKCSMDVINKLYNDTKITPITLRVLINRGFDSSEKIKGFLNNSLNNLHDPYLLKDMDKAIDIMVEAINNDEKIMVYGDYDADGVTSTAILYTAIKNCGGNVDYHIPHRENEGYGMSISRVETIASDGYDLIITCDNGISAIKEVERAKELGLKVIITDHHELIFEEADGERRVILPNSDALVNPKRSDCNYPFKLLCGAGVAYKFSLALYKTLNKSMDDTSELLEFAAIGTICDVVDLVDENRIIAKEGLKILSNTNNKGIIALKKIIGIKEQVSCYNVGFNIGPCINATGRLETAEMSLELLLCKDESLANEISTKVFNLNKERQDLTTESVEQVCYDIENSSLINDKVIVVYKDNIHESIAGIVAGRVKEKYGRPAFVLTKGKEMPKGSGRSIDEYNMFEEMLKCKELLYKFGGHPMAAGLSIEEDNIPKFRELINKNCKLDDNDLAIKIKVDSPIKLNYVDEVVVNEFELLEPFGKGNPGPVLGSIRVKVNGIRFIGSEQQHVKFRFSVEGTDRSIDGLYFNKKEEVEDILRSVYGDGFTSHLMKPEGLFLDVLFQPDINEFMGNRSIQLKVKNIRVSK